MIKKQQIAGRLLETATFGKWKRKTPFGKNRKV
jgi:hypothetical protein